MATSLARVSRPRSCAASAAELAAGNAPPWIETSRPASRDLGPELLAMHELQPLERQEPQPQERRHRVRLANILGPALGGLEERLLDHVRGVDPAAQPMIQPDRDHPPQAVAVGRQELTPVGAIGPDRLNPIPIHAFPRMARCLVRVD